MGDKFVIIPAFNEEEHIEGVIKGCRKELRNCKILVIDDCSTDKTSEKARKARAIVARNPVNMGKGFTLKNALLYLHWNFKMKDDDIILMLDGDGQHDPKYFHGMISILDEEDYIIGQRDLSEYPFGRKLGNWLMSTYVWVFIRKRCDTESGMKAMKWKTIINMLPYILAKGFEIDTQMVLMAGLLGYRVSFINIKSPFLKRERAIVFPGLNTVFGVLKDYIKFKLRG